MRRSLLLLLLPLGLSGCLSFSSSPSPPAQTIVVPPGSTVLCSNGSAPPCQ